MRILVTAGIFPPEIGGPATYVPRIAAALVACRHEVIVVAPQNKGEPCPVVNPPYRLIRFYRPKILRYVNYFVENGRAFLAVYRAARGADLIYINGLDLPATFAAWLRRKPTVVKIVGDSVWELAYNRGWTRLNVELFQSFTSAKIKWLRLVRDTAIKAARYVIVPSEYQCQIVTDWGIDRSRVRVVYNALSLPDKKQARSLLIPDRFRVSFCLLFAGRLIALKRVSQLLAILSQLPEACLLIIGDGPDRANLEQQVAGQGVGDRVLFVGQLSQAELLDLMETVADAVVLISVHETFPHLLLEAANCGLPVVATAVGGIPEIVKHEETGLLVEPDNPVQLLEAITRLQDPSLRRKLGQSAKQLSQRFSFEQMLLSTEAVLREAIK
jgi:glycosyltransferase involved in cell wall biosynthesis